MLVHSGLNLWVVVCSRIAGWADWPSAVFDVNPSLGYEEGSTRILVEPFVSQDFYLEGKGSGYHIFWWGGVQSQAAWDFRNGGSARDSRGRKSAGCCLWSWGLNLRAADLLPEALTGRLAGRSVRRESQFGY
jgi:hypothetical protein